MDSEVLDPETAAALDTITAGFDALFASGIRPADGRDAIVYVKELERVSRYADAANVDVLAAISTDGLHRSDGHSSAKVMVRHLAKLSNPTAAARAKTSRLVGDIDEVSQAYRSGEISTDHLQVAARVHGNARVRDQLIEDYEWILRNKNRSHKDFRRIARKWEEEHDLDGPTPANEIAHEDRNAQLIQGFDKTWDLQGRYAASQGATMQEIFDHYIQAELMADWEKARAEHGDAACADHLSRTANQRRADALWQIFQDAAASPIGAVPPGYVHNIIWDHRTFEETVRRMTGATPNILDPEVSRCETINGVALDPQEAMANALNSKIRRVVIDAEGVVIDLGAARFFTGNAKHAIKLSQTECTWIGCWAPSSQCESDHITEHRLGGQTNSQNGTPLCGKHNRWKEKGFRIWRDPSGTFHIYRPDGTEIE